MSMIERLLKQKLREKSILEKKILKAHKLNNVYLVKELTYGLIIVEHYIMELQK